MPATVANAKSAKDTGSWSIQELADKEKMSRDGVYLWIKLNKLPTAKKDSDGIWRIGKKGYKRPMGREETIKDMASKGLLKRKKSVKATTPKKKVAKKKTPKRKSKGAKKPSE